jgi:uncharacterized protein with HEPN domain
MFDVDKVDREVGLFIFDIFVAIQKIKKVSSQFDNVQNLLHDFMAWDSVIREFEIVGEASKYLLRDKLLANQYQEVVDFRNQIIHEYFGIDQDVVWTIIHVDLDEFEAIIVDTITKLEPKLKQELTDSFIEDNHYLDFIVKALEELKITDE